MGRDFGFLNPLHAKRAFLHHAAHSHGYVGIFLHFGDVRRAFFGERRDVFPVNPEFSGNFLFPDRPLVVIEEIEPAHFERAIVRAIAGADAAIVGHDVEPILAVNGGVDRTNRFARRVLAVLAHHRLMHDLGIFRKFAVVFVEWFCAGVIAIDPQPVHHTSMRDL